MVACSSNGMESIFFIIRDEFEFNDMEYCVLIFVLNLNIGVS